MSCRARCDASSECTGFNIGVDSPKWANTGRCFLKKDIVLDLCTIEKDTNCEKPGKYSFCHEKWRLFLKAVNVPAAGGTCGDPDPNTGGSMPYACPSGSAAKSPPVLSGTCDSLDTCNLNCCDQTCASYSCPEGYSIKNSDSTTMTESNCCQGYTQHPNKNCFGDGVAENIGAATEGETIFSCGAKCDASSECTGFQIGVLSPRWKKSGRCFLKKNIVLSACHDGRNKWDVYLKPAPPAQLQYWRH